MIFQSKDSCRIQTLKNLLLEPETKVKTALQAFPNPRFRCTSCTLSQRYVDTYARLPYTFRLSPNTLRCFQRGHNAMLHDVANSFEIELPDRQHRRGHFDNPSGQARIPNFKEQVSDKSKGEILVNVDSSAIPTILFVITSSLALKAPIGTTSLLKKPASSCFITQSFCEPLSPTLL